MKHVHKVKGRLNIPIIYLHRLIRVIPLILACALFQLSIFKFLGDGPLWRFAIKKSIENCETNFLSSISFATNYFPDDPVFY